MSKADLEKEWEKLCEEHKAALDAYFDISAIVIPNGFYSKRNIGKQSNL